MDLKGHGELERSLELFGGVNLLVDFPEVMIAGFDGLLDYAASGRNVD